MSRRSAMTRWTASSVVVRVAPALRVGGALRRAGRIVSRRRRRPDQARRVAHREHGSGLGSVRPRASPAAHPPCLDRGRPARRVPGRRAARRRRPAGLRRRSPDASGRGEELCSPALRARETATRGGTRGDTRAGARRVRLRQLGRPLAGRDPRAGPGGRDRLDDRPARAAAWRRVARSAARTRRRLDGRAGRAGRARDRVTHAGVVKAAIVHALGRAAGGVLARRRGAARADRAQRARRPLDGRMRQRARAVARACDERCEHRTHPATASGHDGARPGARLRRRPRARRSARAAIRSPASGTSRSRSSGACTAPAASGASLFTGVLVGGAALAGHGSRGCSAGARPSRC